MTNRIQRNADTARRRFEEVRSSFDPERLDEARTPFLESLADRQVAMHAELESLIEAIDSQFRALHNDPEADVEAVDSDVVEALERWAADRENHAETLGEAVDPERREQLEKELIDLSSRHRLLQRIDKVEERIGHLREIEKLTTARDALATNRISIRQRQLTELAVTDGLEKALREELDRLRCGHLPVELDPRISVGESEVGLQLAGARGRASVADIFSEGEQRALSLAFFLAEITAADHDGGLIVDDPVSSLDHERREYIAHRLVNEAATRQVIVFTHDLPFVFSLKQEADENVPFEMRCMWRTGDQVGRVDDHAPPEVMGLRRRVGALRQEVQQWDNEAVDDFSQEWNRICAFYTTMRKCWERSVEERLFQGVVQRFQPQIKTRQLRNVDIGEEHLDAIEEGMTRCSEFAHDLAPARGTSLPGREELEADLQSLVDFEEATRPS